MQSRRLVLIFVTLFAVSAVSGCRSAPPPAKTRQIGWRPIGTWSGRGDTQTESFNIESTQWRIKWDTKGSAPANAGRFHLIVHSAVSGRTILDTIEHQGDGHGVTYVTEDPRLYHLEIVSSGVDWSIAVQEAVAGEVETPR